MSDERRQIIAQILTYPANTYSREFLDGPHPKTGKPYSNAELNEYLGELEQAAAKRKQTAAPSAEELYRQEEISFRFLARHKHDFNNCAANIGLIKGYFQEPRLEWTLENLEQAFAELRSQLAPAGAVITPQPSASEPPPPPVPVAPAVQPVVEPLAMTMEDINKWDGQTMRRKMADPLTRKQIDAVLAVEAELSRLEREQNQRQQIRENQ